MPTDVVFGPTASPKSPFGHRFGRYTRAKGEGGTHGTVTGKGPGTDTGRVRRTHENKEEEEQRRRTKSEEKK